MNVGIDQIGFYTPNYYLDLRDLAYARHEDPNKYLIGIGQERQAVPPASQDAVTMAANAATQVVTAENRNQISLIIFGTESGVDNSKSGAIYLQQLLGLKREARAFEIKQACYGATAGLQLAKDFVAAHPDRVALVVGSDVARYGLNTPGEVTQGCGAIAMTVSAQPRTLAISPNSSVYSDDIMDFWRPINHTEALVDGHYSNDIYQQFFQKTIQAYCAEQRVSLTDFRALTFHLPYSKLGLKALRTILPEVDESQQQQWLTEFEASRVYNRQVGNLYTGSLYLSLLSLLDHSQELTSGDQIGLFSYGSGAQGEFFAGTLQADFQNYNRRDQIEAALENRQRLDVYQYEEFFTKWPTFKTANVTIDPALDDAEFVFTGVIDNKRQYRRR
ncbi:hydroxymethylglutaryl-CoA synthase [Fructilactobacillus carniphilus]|uniref:Hydroxymethylglutaryl-CoA synthase n=1 Tax=Fructilactobacillus carniphilus TaxID=2940297 RepID=A0ABY5BYV0_9LACO|nr:hydroxymethylglutaryl-CoA synthase [Fructilactobacillus carniphilus]USS90959.1 hydroxymethylglutaryl-CoA synthase [Fructilactobacillus carniphilus]